jgi:hypothetical protein
MANWRKFAQSGHPEVGVQFLFKLTGLCILINGLYVKKTIYLVRRSLRLLDQFIKYVGTKLMLTRVQGHLDAYRSGHCNYLSNRRSGFESR